MFAIPALRRLRQGDVELRANLGYLSRPCLKKMGVLNLGAFHPFISRRFPLTLCEHSHFAFSSLDLVTTIDGLVFSGYFPVCSRAQFSILHLFILVCLCARLMRGSPKDAQALIVKNYGLFYYKAKGCTWNKSCKPSDLNTKLGSASRL